jgi:hypothetical protein
MSFYTYGEELLDKPIAKIQKREDGTLVIKVLEFGLKIMSEYHALQLLPASMIPNPEDKQMLLAYMAGKDTLIVMYYVMANFTNFSQAKGPRDIPP